MSTEQLIYVGTYTQPILFGTGDILQGKGQGIHIFSLDVQTGALIPRGVTRNTANPSYLCFSPDHHFLYAVNELKQYKGEACGSVSAFQIDSISGELTYLNTQPTGGADPCHVVVNQLGTHLFVSNFMSGSVCVLPLAADGLIDPYCQLIQHQGSSVLASRQSGPHAHSLSFDRTQTRAFVPDLGIDKLMIYATDFRSGQLSSAPMPFFKAAPGAGPRHCEFHHNYRFCYLINEIASSISLLYYDEQACTLEHRQTIATIPEDYTNVNICADLHLTPDGRYLYGSNRGHDSISAFAVDQQSGMLTPIETISCGGKTPRNFTVDLTGQFIIVGNQDSDNLLSFRINNSTGRLTKTFETDVPTPVCVKPILLSEEIL